jgi:hypothetical protein
VVRRAAGLTALTLLAAAGTAGAQEPVAPQLSAPTTDVTVRTRHHSSRGVAPKLIVLHSTESRDRPGLADLRNLGTYFARGPRGVSSHVANDASGHDARYVGDGRSAHTQGRYNRVSLSIEQIGYARFSRAQWLSRPGQLLNTAAWIAHWRRAYGIPIRRAVTRRGRVVSSGVATHAQLSRTGANSTHWDPGPGYPVDLVLALARRRAGG